jgi:GGDEF domain-containing protein
MRILDEISDKSLENIILYLTFSEASELRDSLDDILKKPVNNHIHISSENIQKEITVCIYDINNLKGFNKRSMDLIIKDK